MPRCTCNNCVRCAGVPEWDARVTTMLSVWRGHWLWDHQTRTLVGPTSQQNHASVWALPFCWVFEMWVPGLLSSKYWIWNFLFPIGPCGAYCLGLWGLLKETAESGPVRERDLEVFYECEQHQELTYLSLGWFVFCNFCLW